MVVMRSRLLTAAPNIRKSSGFKPRKPAVDHLAYVRIQIAVMPTPRRLKASTVKESAILQMMIATLAHKTG